MYETDIEAGISFKESKLKTIVSIFSFDYYFSVVYLQCALACIIIISIVMV